MNTGSIKRALFLFPTDVMGGAENVTRMLADAAVKSDLFDEIVCFVLCRPSTGTLDELATDPRVKLVYTNAGSEKWGLFHLLSILAKQNYDLVFSSHTHLNAAASLTRTFRLLRTSRLVSRESTMMFERDLPFPRNFVRQFYRVYGKQDLIVCQTARMAKSLTDHTGARFSSITRTIPNPIDLNGIADARSKSADCIGLIGASAKKIVWCGRLSPVKSPLRAIDALAVLHQQGRADTHLVMIGAGPMKAECENHAKTRGLSEHLTLTGRLKGPASVMQHCQVGLMTSDTEGFPNVILEMLAAGVPSVVTTDCAGGLSEIPGVGVASSKTPDALAAELAVGLDQLDSHPEIEDFLTARDPDSFLKRMLKG